MMKVMATFETQAIAESMRDLLAEHGFDPHGAVIMANRGTPEPPEDARLEVGPDGVGGLEGLEIKVGRTVNALLGKEKFIEGTGSEGQGNTGALLTIEVPSHEDADRAVKLLTLHQAADVEVVPES